MNLLFRIKQSSRELLLFVAASLALGMAFSMVDSTFNNFLNDKFALTGFQRSFLEFPRELPGFLVVFVSAAIMVPLLAPAGRGGDDSCARSGRC